MSVKTKAMSHADTNTPATTAATASQVTTMSSRLLLLLAVALAGFGCGSTYDRRDPTGETFPSSEVIFLRRRGVPAAFLAALSGPGGPQTMAS